MIKIILHKYRNLPIQVKVSFWFLICSFSQKAISALTTPIFTRFLSNDEYGKFSVYSSWQSILGVFLTLNLFYGVYTSGLVKFKKQRPEFISAMQGLMTVLVLGWLFLYLLFYEWFNQLFSFSTVQAICLIISTWAGAIFSFWSAEQRVDYKYKKLVVVTLLVSILKPLLGVVVIVCFDDKVTARIIELAVVELVCFSWMFVVQIKRCKKIFSKFFWGYALKFNIPLIPHYLAQNVLGSADRIMIEKMVSGGAAGIYSLAYSVSLIMNLFNTVLTQTISPWVYTKIKMREEKEIQKIVFPTIYIVAGVNLFLIAFAPEVIRIFAPPEYYEAIWIIPPVVMSVYFIYLYNVFSFFEFYFEKTTFITVATLIAAMMNVILNHVFIGLYGYIAAGYTTLVCYILYAFGHYVVMRMIAKRNLDGNEVISASRLMLITIIFMVIGFLFCSLYRYTLIRFSLLIVLIIIIIAFRNKIIQSISDILDTRKNKL